MSYVGATATGQGYTLGSLASISPEVKGVKFAIDIFWDNIMNQHYVCLYTTAHLPNPQGFWTHLHGDSNGTFAITAANIRGDNVKWLKELCKLFETFLIGKYGIGGGGTSTPLPEQIGNAIKTGIIWTNAGTYESPQV